MGLVLDTFFLASAGASAAYLTVSEIFPMETRALAIAFFYAIGTAIGGITGPLVFSKLIASGDTSQAGLAFLVGAVVMAVGGVAELLFGVKAEQASLEDIAKPLTAEDADDDERTEHASGRRRDPEAEERAHSRDTAPGRRFRPGPARGGSSPGMPVSAPITEVEFAREVGRIEAALNEHGPMERAELARAVGARFWGPGRFPAALREAVVTGRVHRLSRTQFGPGDGAQGTRSGRFTREPDAERAEPRRR
jgi:hypothetical protein